MAPDEYIWNQLDQIHDHLRFVGGQAMTWYAFGVGANTAAAWAIFKPESTLRTNIVLGILVVSNILAIVALAMLPCYYLRQVATIKKLTEQLSVYKVHATDALPLNPAFDHVLWIAVACLMIASFSVITVGWLIVIFGKLISKRVPRATTAVVDASAL